MTSDGVTSDGVTSDGVTSDGASLEVSPSDSPQHVPFNCGRRGNDASSAVLRFTPDGGDAPPSRQIASADEVFPLRAVVLVLSEGFGPSTGWLYGPDIVATAGHCVNTGESVWAPITGKFHLRVGYRARQGEPYTWCGARRLYAARGWSDGGDERYDYGAIKLDRDIGTELGWFGIGWSDADRRSRQARVIGYGMRGWHELRSEADFDPIQFVSQGSLVSESDGQAFYDAPTARGTSGGPVLVAGEPDWNVAAIHTKAAHPDEHLPEPHRHYSHGTAIGRHVFENLMAWRADSR